MQIEADALAQMISDAVAKAVTAKKTKSGKADKPKKERHILTDEERAERRAKVDDVTTANFKAKGYKDVQPRINVMTYDKWIENGRRVKKGEKSVKCGTWPLFHIDQTEAIETKH